MKSKYSIQKFAIVIAFACVCFMATPVSAGNNLKNGFEDQIGRLLAVEVINLGHAILAPVIYGRPQPVRYRPHYTRRGIFSHCNYTDPNVMAFCIDSAIQSNLHYYESRY